MNTIFEQFSTFPDSSEKKRDIAKSTIAINYVED